jgi:N-succinyldiaminopimelate aminotransferase
MPCYPRLSHTADGLSANVYTSLLALAEQSGREVLALNVGDTYLEPPTCASVEALAKGRFAGMHRYAPVRGEPARAGPSRAASCRSPPAARAPST